MGYTSYLSGEISIEPPIPWPELQGSPFIRTATNKEWDRLLWLRMDETTVETDEGTLTRKQAVAIRPSQADELRAHSLVRELQEIVKAHGAGRAFIGFILVRGEESPDIWRAAVHEGEAVEIVPRIVWPDGTEESAH
ncbi:hypothetical protein Sme01_03670 [Sphaerisporangium melleum]|uniref:Uncharacterized protein n=1 Tax=Sphaerisporangium melleum TaxID=321316 RepID=A0A917QP21_9ACTN|nr:DUF6205 family protein [Sphaerisporangium melleum]GGK61821.1 hypothetical protein GCM10007964_01220 [Sphaerisporangium melleum]GII67891.1 hypothetical protein Sme01_03670 [Sphaerisporangium melleum]